MHNRYNYFSYLSCITYLRGTRATIVQFKICIKFGFPIVNSLFNHALLLE